ncbi:FlgD immunoglobulin-like domain containing protein, partial [Candidatus Eisenbacteria bacterium]
VGGREENSIDITVPHQPTRYARLMLTCTNTGVFGKVCSDSFFTVDAAIELIQFNAAPAPGTGDGVILSWNTNPGPEDLSGYRLTKNLGSDWETIVPLTRETSYVDQDAATRAQYRLFAINGLGEVTLLGDTAIGSRAVLDAWPRTYHGGVMNISFATGGGLDGSAERATVKLYDASGRIVRTIVDDRFAAGNQGVTWDGRDERGLPVQGGIYFLRASSGMHQNTLRVLIVR